MKFLFLKFRILLILSLMDKKTIGKQVKQLVKTHGLAKVLKTSGLDKSVIYRLIHKQNVTLDKFLVLMAKFPREFRPEFEMKDTSDKLEKLTKNLRNR